MIPTTLAEEKERQEFAIKAAVAFSKDPNVATFSITELCPGALLAIRWGLLDRSVLIVKIEGEPVCYRDIIISIP